VESTAPPSTSETQPRQKPLEAKRPALHRLASSIAGVEALDAPAGKVLGVLSKTIRPGRLRDALSGTFLGHTLHPLLTDVPIGTWTSALILDLSGGPRAEPAARRLIGVGVLAALPTATTGWVEWADSAKTRTSTRRVGIVHAAANVTALSLYGASYVARRRGNGGRGLALAGAGALAVGGHLGGHLSYVHGEGVAVTTFEDGPHEWTPAIAEAELAEGSTTCADVAGVPVLIARQGGRLHALANRCNHRGGPLHEGELGDGCVTCPWHGSRFALEDGAVDRGPASSPQPVYATRVRDGRIEVRQLTDPTP
jgi:nitrite reductase/ring-hydroxylating ferredoxin subunit